MKFNVVARCDIVSCTCQELFAHVYLKGFKELYTQRIIEGNIIIMKLKLWMLRALRLRLSSLLLWYWDRDVVGGGQGEIIGNFQGFLGENSGIFRKFRRFFGNFSES